MPKPQINPNLFLVGLILHLLAVSVELWHVNSRISKCTLRLRSEARIYRTPLAPPGLSLLAKRMCTAEGFMINGIEPYRKYWHLTSKPSIYDAFLDESTLTIVFCTQFSHVSNEGYNHTDLPIARRFAVAHWLCRLGNKEPINNSFHKVDPSYHTHVLQFVINDLNDVVAAGLKATIYTSDNGVEARYEDVPFCVLPPRPLYSNDRQFAAICTQNWRVDPEIVADWMAWHHYHGFEHGLLYINDNVTESMRESVGKLIDPGWLTIVDWSWPKTWYLHDQTASQTSCIYRMKGRVKWLGMNDLDEIYIPGNGTVKDVLLRYESRRKKMGALAGCNRWIQGKEKRIGNLTQCAVNCTVMPFRQKCVVNPDGVDFFYVHTVRVGLPEVWTSNFELVSGHYRMPAYDPTVFQPCNDVQRHKAAMIREREKMRPRSGRQEME